MFERIIERLSLSRYKDSFTLKGGLLIASMIGVESRSTLDMDTTVKNILMDDDIIREAIQEFIQIDIEDGIEFVYQKMEPIRLAVYYRVVSISDKSQQNHTIHS